MSMTESEIKEEIKELRRKAKIFEDSGYATVGISSSFKNSADIIENLFEEIQQYRAIGTVSEFRELKEKATAKKPIKTYYSGMPTFLCPVCEEEVCEGQKFCDECGQAVMKLDWSEGKE